MTNDYLCPKYTQQEVTIMHVLRDCNEVMYHWNEFVSQNCWEKFNYLGLQQWLYFNLTQKEHIPSGTQATFFGISIYNLWRDMNNLVFNKARVLANDFKHQILAQMHSITNSFKRLNIDSPYGGMTKWQIVWTAPSPQVLGQTQC